MKKTSIKSMSFLSFLAICLSGCSFSGGGTSPSKPSKPSSTSGSSADVDNPLTFEYVEYDRTSKAYEVLRCENSSKVKQVTIPSTYDDGIHGSMPVMSVADYAFYECQYLTSINIPNSIEIIGKFAFRYCSSLKTININMCEYIDSPAFLGCTSLTSIETNPNNKEYKSVDGILFSKDLTGICCYPAGKKATTYTIPKEVKNIEVGAFSYCTNLKSINIHSENTSGLLSSDGVLYGAGGVGEYNMSCVLAYPGGKTDEEYQLPSELGDIYTSRYSFSGNKHLKKIIGDFAYYPRNKLNTLAFEDCSSLSNFGNAYSVSDGIAYLGDTMVGILPSNQNATITVPSFIRTIDSAAFYGRYVTTVNVGQYVTRINELAFYECLNLASINGMENTAEIYHSFFEGCPKITITVEDNIRYVKIGDNKYFAMLDTDKNKDEISEVRVHDGCRVICCKDDIGEGQIKIKATSLILPEGLKFIGHRAFDDVAIRSITIPSTVTYIGFDCFLSMIAECLKSINVSENNNNFKSIDGVLFNKAGTELIQYPDAKSGETYEIPNGVIKLQSNSLNSRIVKTVYIPQTVEEISNNFTNILGSLVAINVDNNNANYSSIDGVLFNKDQTELLRYPPCKHNTNGYYAIPETVETISDAAFSEYRSSKKILIPQSFKTQLSQTVFDSYSFPISVYVYDKEIIPARRMAGDKTVYYVYSEVEPTEEGDFWHFVDDEPTSWQNTEA